MGKLIIDTDTGVDDAVAIAWLLTQQFYAIDILGITAVAGNTTVDNAANNILTLLSTLHRTDIPVTVGAAKPLCRSLTKSNQLIHGPDGLWGGGAMPAYDTNLLAHNPSRFYQEVLNKHEDVTLLALGPLTNLALAVNQYPDVIQQFERIIILGGTQSEGSMTPVADYNFWQDPEAADVVLSANLPITLVPREAFIPFTITISDLQALQGGKTAVLKLLYTPLRRYISIQNQLGGVAAATIPDLIPAIYAADSKLGLTKPALVKVITGGGPVRGQTVMGFTLQERVSMIISEAEMNRLAEDAFNKPDFNLLAHMQEIAAREPANCQVLTNIQVEKMRSLFLDALLNYEEPDETEEQDADGRYLRPEPSFS